MYSSSAAWKNRDCGTLKHVLIGGLGKMTCTCPPFKSKCLTRILQQNQSHYVRLQTPLCQIFYVIHVCLFYFNSNDKHIAWSSKTIHIAYTIDDFCHIDFYVGRKVQHKMLYKHTSPGPGLTFLQWSLRSILQTFSNSGSIWIVSSRAKNSTRSCFLHLGEILWASASSNVSFLTMSARQ